MKLLWNSVFWEGESLGCYLDRCIMKGYSMKDVLICDHRKGSFQLLLCGREELLK